MSLNNSLGAKLIEKVKIEIPDAFINETHRICVKCNKLFTYNHSDEFQILFRKLTSTKKGDLRFCFSCDEIDEKE